MAEPPSKHTKCRGYENYICTRERVLVYAQLRQVRRDSILATTCRPGIRVRSTLRKVKRPPILSPWPPLLVFGVEAVSVRVFCNSSPSLARSVTRFWVVLATRNSNSPPRVLLPPRIQTILEIHITRV